VTRAEFVQLAAISALCAEMRPDSGDTQYTHDPCGYEMCARACVAFAVHLANIVDAEAPFDVVEVRK